MRDTPTDEMETAAVIHMASAAFMAEAEDDPGEERIRKAIIAACIARSGTPDEDEDESVVVEGQVTG
jgi:hypothetical protein